MIIEQELKAVELSPVKKDFYQEWNELLDIAQKLSARWDPTSTNESDPGIVLLKVLTAICDKLNYNIDKNILEAFMPSASQEESMRKLCDMLGYSMKYYQSATTTVVISYTGEEDNVKADIPQFTTLSDIDNEVVYTTIEPGSIYKTTVAGTATKLYDEIICIEGSHQICETNDGQRAISYSLLDDNYRYYMPESMIAENGIFVYDYAEDQKYSNRWTQVDNLNTQPGGTKCYKFGFDSRLRVPYLQFPEDVGTLMTDGIEIHYIRTNGIDGNIAARTLEHINGSITSQLSADDAGTDITSDLSVTNLSAAMNGKNAETLTQAYNSFKKTVGTFDTLVACRDYMNKIYNLFNDVTNIPLVSNAVAADVRDDINRAFTLCELSDYGIKYTNMKATKTVEQSVTGKDAGDNIITITVETQEPRINNFDLVLYPFKTIYGTNTKTEYEDSFKYTEENRLLIESGLEQNKTLAHNFIYPEIGDITCIKNYLKLNAKITTTTKVNSAEEKSILGSIYTAISASFNAREVDFGEDIPFDSILKVIEQADPRIKNVALDEPELYTAVQYKTSDGTKEVTLTGSYSGLDAESIADEEKRKIYLNKLILRNILAGRVAAFDYDTSFKRAYNEQAYGNSIKPMYPQSDDDASKIVKLTSECRIPVTNADTVLTDNEVVSFRAPNFVTTFTYPSYVNYFLHLTGSTHSIAANADYQLKTSEWIAFTYTSSTKDDEGQSSETVINKVYGAGEIIKPNLQLFDSKYNKTENGKKPSKTSGYNFDSQYMMEINTTDYPGMFTFGPNEQVEIRKKAGVEFNSPSYFYWTLTPTAGDEKGIDLGSRIQDNKYVLKENEYIYYTDAAQVSMAYYGQGTEVQLYGVDASTLKLQDNDIEVPAEKIAQMQLRDIPWKYLNLDSIAHKIFLQEYQYVNLTKGDRVKGPIYYSASSISITELNNTWTAIKPATLCKYSDGSSVQLQEITVPDAGWEVRSILEFNMGPAVNQTLYKTYDKINILSYATNSTILPTPTTITDTLSPIQLAYPTNSTGLSITANGTVTGRGTCTDAVVVLPNTITITSIGAQAFETDKTITTLYIPEGVTIIGNKAFSSATKLAAVYNYATVPASMTTTASNLPFSTLATYPIYVPSADRATYIANSAWNVYTNRLCELPAVPLALKSNYPIQASADNIDVSVKTADGKVINDFKISTCKPDNNDQYSSLNNKSNYWTELSAKDISSASPTYTLHINLPAADTVPGGAENYGLIAIKNSLDKNLTLTAYEVGSSSTTNRLAVFNSEETPTGVDTINIPANKFREVQIIGATTNSGCDIKLSTAASAKGTVLFSQLDVVKGINPQLSYQVCDASLASLTISEAQKQERQMLSDIRDMGATVQNNFYYNTLLDNSTAIDIDKDGLLTDPKYLYDYNNINNKFVISEVHYDSMKEGITIARSSKL